MKKFLLIILSSLLLQFAFADKVYKTFSLAGVTYNKWCEAKSSDYYEYDENGNMTLHKQLDGDYISYKYKDNKLIEEYNSSSRNKAKFIYKNDKLIQRKDKYLITTYEYDGNGNLIRELRTGKDGHYRVEILFEYDENNNEVKKETMEDEDSKIEEISEYKNNKLFRKSLIYSKNYYAPDEILEYDENGNVSYHEIQYKSGTTLIYKYENGLIVYWSKKEGSLLDEKFFTYDSENHGFMIFQLSGLTPHTEPDLEIFLKNGKVILTKRLYKNEIQEQYEYDENGNETYSYQNFNDRIENYITEYEYYPDNKIKSKKVFTIINK